MNDDAGLRDDVMTALGDAPRHDVDPARSDRIRHRCRAALASHAAPGGGKGAASRRPGLPLEPAVVVALSAVYLADVLRRAAQLLGP